MVLIWIVGNAAARVLVFVLFLTHIRAQGISAALTLTALSLYQNATLNAGLFYAQFPIKHNFAQIKSLLHESRFVFAQRIKNLAIGKPMFDTLAGHDWHASGFMVFDVANDIITARQDMGE